MKAIPYLGVNPDNGRPLFQRMNADKSIAIVDSLPLAKAAGLPELYLYGICNTEILRCFTNTFV
ncbi:hypothetical protein, partial [Chitinophaga pinensis]|uniref:hypothetical protein n=1 Tax=Chitinophaga pinensis TaxID=79329 RepID=UPI001C98F6D8